MRINIGIIEKDYDSTAVVFGDDKQSWRGWYNMTFSPDIECHVIQLAIHGKTYAERKENLRDLAINYDHESIWGLSWGEWALIEGWFEEQGRRYGLLEEFRENGIC